MSDAGSIERAWVRLQSGRRLNLLNPDPRSWTHRDLAIGLARTNRWGGHSCWTRPLSVAQHSLLVLALRQRSSLDRALDRGESLRELLHDADEGMLSFDPISPLKPHLGGDYGHLVGRLRAAVAIRYRLPEWDAASYAAHKHADRLAAASEAVHVAGWDMSDLKETLGMDIVPLTADPLALPQGCEPWEPWPADEAGRRFLAALEGLIEPDDLDVKTAQHEHSHKPLLPPD